MGRPGAPQRASINDPGADRGDDAFDGAVGAALEPLVVSRANQPAAA